MTFYLFQISGLAATVFIFSLGQNFGKPERRIFRGSMFIALGLSTVIPVIHLVFFKQYVHGYVEPTLINWFLGGVCYIGGCLIYINRIPEKWYPGKFCILVKYIIFNII
jgi:adiponectin receptor